MKSISDLYRSKNFLKNKEKSLQKPKKENKKNLKIKEKVMKKLEIIKM